MPAEAHVPLVVPWERSWGVGRGCGCDLAAATGARSRCQMRDPNKEPSGLHGHRQCLGPVWLMRRPRALCFSGLGCERLAQEQGKLPWLWGEAGDRQGPWGLVSRDCGSLTPLTPCTGSQKTQLPAECSFVSCKQAGVSSCTVAAACCGYITELFS